jgi:hypothetical protein
LHLAVKGVEAIQSTKMVRALLVNGASRNVRDAEGKKAYGMVSSNLTKDLRNELKGILKTPHYCECCIAKYPLVPIKQNWRTVVLFSVLSIYIYFNMFCVLFPGKIHNGIKDMCRTAILVLCLFNINGWSEVADWIHHVH